MLSGYLSGNNGSFTSGSLPPDSLFVSGNVPSLAIKIQQGISGFLIVADAGQRVNTQRKMLTAVLSGSHTSGMRPAT
jgi:hypothetical protein